VAGRSAIITAETFRFLRELAHNNSKAWMDANRERYQAHVVAPFRALLEALAPAALQLHDGFDTSGRTGANFSRINRDIRFAKDKTPYRAQMYLTFKDAAEGENPGGQLHAGVAADAVTVGFRIYAEAKTSKLVQLAAPRAAENPAWIKKQHKRLGKKFESYWYSVEKAEWTKHDGWPLEPESWKRIRGWVVRKKMKPAAATRPAFPAETAKIFRELAPLYHFASSARWKR
jgi:uncharacterized protein (TIGR02453 family)